MKKIGNITIDNPFVLAPMAGVTDLPFRILCREQGAGLICMEMVSAKAIQFNNKNTRELLRIAEGEHPVSLQLFGADPKIISEMARRIEELPFDILDINMGCPVPKVVKNGEGSALMREPRLIGQIVEQTAKAINKPVTVKIRKGFDEHHINAVEVAKIAEQAGAAAIAVHGRTREQYYTGKADWDIIRRVKEAVSVPVMGNGDVTTPREAKLMTEETGCDFVMIGRAVRGNPWIFSRMNHYFQTGELLAPPSDTALRDMMLRHARMEIALKGEYTGIREMRKHVAWYTAGIPHSAKLRRALAEMENYGDLEKGTLVFSQK